MTWRFAIALALGIASGSTRLQGQSTFVVRDVRIFDGASSASHRSVLVEHGLIRRIGGSRLPVPRGTIEIDGTGRTLLPGLIDAHVHLSDSLEGDLRQALSLGVTTVLDMWNGSTRFERIKALRAIDSAEFASVRTAGVGATAPGGHPSQMGGPPFPTVADSNETESFVDARIAEGSDYIKIMYDDLASFRTPLPMLDRRTLVGLVVAAHKRGKVVVVHIGTEAQARTVIEAGADGLAHLFAAPTVSATFAPLVARHRAFVIPTLGVLYGLCGKPNGASTVADSFLQPYIRPSSRERMSVRFSMGGAPKSCEGTDHALRELAKHHVPILTGTDAPAPGQTYGASVHGELALFVGAGLTPSQALAAATSAPASAFRLTDRGRIAPGLRADLLLVDGDPTTTITATRRIVMIWKRGVEVKRVRYNILPPSL